MERKILLMWSVVVMLMTIPATVFGAEERAQIALTDAERALVNGSNNFAFRLLRQANTGESRILSPLSITYALGMVNNGAAGQTQAEINEVLGGSGATPDVINTFCQKMLSQAAALDPDTKVCMANNIYMNEGYELLAPFVKKAKTYYDAIPEVRNFKDGKTMDVINQWASDHTEQMVKEVLNKQTFNDDAASYLLNALYFKGTWTIKFDKQNTVMEPFDNGGEEPMMRMKATFGYDETDTYQAVRLPYGNEAFQMTIFLPRKGMTVADVLGQLDNSNWQMKGLPREVDLKLPRIETETSQDLKPVMRALGMPTAFDRDLAEFPDFCYPLTYIAEMRQMAKITLNEEGTEASAVTTIEMVEKSGPSTATFYATRPFVYVISELSTGAIFFVGQYMGAAKKGSPAPKTIELTEAEQALVKGNNDFAFRLLEKANTGESRILSPLSITYALGMLNNGATGVTQQEINQVLGGDGATVADINSFCRKMLSETVDLDKDTKVNIANTVFVNKEYQLLAPFVEAAKTYYNATPESRDFNDGKTMGAINQWASDNTEQMIKKVLDEQTFNPYAVSYLLNAIYFNGLWTNKFDKKNTVMERFNFGDEVPMMHQREAFYYSENDTYQAVRLPYGNKAYLMTVYLPREDKTVDDVLSQLNGSNWQQNGHTVEIDLKLPRFETETGQDLIEIMSALGMPTAFDWQKAEFNNFCSKPTYIGKMLQKAKIKVDEEGTEAAAVTIIGVETTAIPNYTMFHATRPFVYVISEQSTGAIFFVGQYMGGTTAGVPTAEMTVTSKSTAEPQLYNIEGQRLNTPPAHGIFIVDGKKVIR